MTPEYVAPAPQPSTSSPAPAPRRPRARTKPAPKPVVVRRLPTRDTPIVRVDETRVLGVAELVRAPEPSSTGLSASTAIFGVWFGLGAAMLLLAGATPLLAAASPFGERLTIRRGQIAFTGLYMLVGLAVGYLVVLATS